MGVASSERSALEELAAARVRGAKPETLLELSEAAIERATAAGDLELIAAELDSAATAHPDQGDGLRLRLAAEHAHAIASQAPLSAPSDAPAPPAPHLGTTNVAFRVAVAIVVLALFSFGAIAVLGDVSASYVIAYVVLFLVPLGLLFVGLALAVGFVRWLRERRGDQ